MLIKTLKFGLAGTLTIGAASFVFPDQFTPVSKMVNVGVAGAKVFWVYKYSQASAQQKNIKAAQYLRDALRKNSGLYLKLGQLVATLDVIVPDEFRNVMISLTRDCSSSTYDQVKKTIQQETGKPIDQLFSRFEKEPISSASIGQVHYGILKTGQQVAVKIQHRELSKNTQYDLKLMRLFVRLANMAFKNFKYNWLLQQFQKNIHHQLDFTQQSANIAHLSSIISVQKLKNISVPLVYLPTTPKLLIMQYIKGYHIDQVEKMKQQKIDLKKIGKLFSTLVIRMIHREGFVHGDPHAGNLKVRLKKDGQAELVILDHGLYQVLPHKLRKAYNRFWLGIILNDQKLYDPAARELGSTDPKILRSMLTSKSQDELNKPSRKLFDLNPSSDKQAILKSAQENHTRIIDTLNELDRSILLLLKVNEFVRSIENTLGGREFGVYEDIAKECVNNSDVNWIQKYFLYWKMYRAH